MEYFDEALAKFEQLIALQERLDEAHYYVGRIEMGRDRYTEAIEAFAAKLASSCNCSGERPVVPITGVTP